jgi:nucleotide-binding universal stress UspA family protein
MYRTIMVPTDGSGFDREAILVALRVAERCNAKIRLVRVLSPNSHTGFGISPDGVIATTETGQAEHDTALGELYGLATECRSISAAEISVDLEEGPIRDVLAGYAKRNDVDLIVISSHGRRGIARLSLGSVTDSLIRGTTIPVLVVKPKASYLAPQATKEFHHLVVPLDGSALAEQILERVVPLAKVEEAEITLLHVVTTSSDSNRLDPAKAPWWGKKVAGAQAYLARRAREIRLQGVATKIDVVVGNKIAESITDYARTNRADLIAIATHGRGGFARVLHGSVADAVTKLAMSSILVFHPEMTVSKTLSPHVGEKDRRDISVFA